MYIIEFTTFNNLQKMRSSGHFCEVGNNIRFRQDCELTSHNLDWGVMMQFLSMLNMHYWHICSMMCCCASWWSDSNRSSEGTTGGRYNTASSVLGWRQLLGQGRHHSYASPCFIMLLWYSGVPVGVLFCVQRQLPPPFASGVRPHWEGDCNEAKYGQKLHHPGTSQQMRT